MLTGARAPQYLCVRALREAQAASRARSHQRFQQLRAAAAAAAATPAAPAAAAGAPAPSIRELLQQALVDLNQSADSEAFNAVCDLAVDQEVRRLWRAGNGKGAPARAAYGAAM